MTVIDLSASQFLLPLLQKMLLGLTQLSSSDSVLNQKTYELHHFLSDPKQVDGEALMQTVLAAKDLASSYDVKTDLPNIFFNAMTELEHLIKSKKLMSKSSKVMLDINRFYRLAHADDHIKYRDHLIKLVCDPDDKTDWTAYISKIGDKEGRMPQFGMHRDQALERAKAAIDRMIQHEKD